MCKEGKWAQVVNLCRKMYYRLACRPYAVTILLSARNQKVKVNSLVLNLSRFGHLVTGKVALTQNTIQLPTTIN